MSPVLINIWEDIFGDSPVPNISLRLNTPPPLRSHRLTGQVHQDHNISPDGKPVYYKKNTDKLINDLNKYYILYIKNIQILYKLMIYLFKFNF